ncbi:MAG TPA: hypothetical protein VD995_04655 [Azospirillum sp.]|nr:hypothetical protein [Azospirillum sp.]
MKKFVFYDKGTGEIVGRGHCAPEHFPPGNTYGFGVAEGEGDAATHRVDVTTTPPAIVPA